MGLVNSGLKINLGNNEQIRFTKPSKKRKVNGKRLISQGTRQQANFTILNQNVF